MPARDLQSHQLKIALIQPQIAPNTGNIARLCVATGSELHLVRPLGFVLSDHKLRRSAMDYWPRLRLVVHDDQSSFLQRLRMPQPNFWLFSSKSQQTIWDVRFDASDYLIFGSETHGLAHSWLDQHAHRSVRIPQAPDERCLNLSTAAGIALYEALRQIRERVGH